MKKVEFYSNFKYCLTLKTKFYEKKVITDWSIYENDELDEKATTAQVQLNDNVGDFPGLPFSPAALLALIVTFHNVISAPVYPEKTADTLVAKNALLNALKKNGNKINEIADGDVVLLAKSGYPLAKDRTPVGQLEPAKIKNINSISKGFEIDLEKVPHAESYLVLVWPSNEKMPEDFKNWEWHFFHKTKGSITGLQASTKYKIVPVALGNDSTLTFGDSVERTTQG